VFSKTANDVGLYSDDFESGRSLDALFERSDSQRLMTIVPRIPIQRLTRIHMLSEASTAQSMKEATEVGLKKAFWRLAESFHFLNGPKVSVGEI
jgi:hypothetical protein